MTPAKQGTPIVPRSYPPDEMEFEFSPRLKHPDRQATVDGHAERGNEMMARLQPIRDVRYGPGALQTMDIFPGHAPSSPACTIIHGGYWRSSDKRYVVFVAEPLIEAGAAVFVVNYDLCPDVGLDTIVAQIREAVAWIAANATIYSADSDRIHLLGHSAGAHLAAMMLCSAADAATGFDPNVIAGALLASGVYETRPLVSLPVNAELGLTTETAERNCPLILPFIRRVPIFVAAAEGETNEFIEQSRDLSAVATANGLACAFFLVEGVGHFTILDRLADPAEQVTAAFIEHLKTAASEASDP